MRFLLFKLISRPFIFIVGVLGALDGSHVKIKKPPTDDAEEFRCRKGYMSVNVQCICSPDLKFTNIVARWKGSTHDSRIWRNSHIYSRFLANEFEGYLLGDNGYPCTSHVLTPLLQPTSPPERHYNASHIRTRNAIERAFGLWKSRFQCLQNTLRFSPRRCCNIIVATAILHNFAIEQHAPPVDTFFDDDASDEPFQAQVDSQGDILRRHIIESYFS